MHLSLPARGGGGGGTDPRVCEQKHKHVQCRPNLSLVCLKALGTGSFGIEESPKVYQEAR